MAVKQRKNRSFSIFICIMVILLVACIILFVYGSMTNGVVQPKLPGKGLFALGTMLPHG